MNEYKFIIVDDYYAGEFTVAATSIDEARQLASTVKGDNVVYTDGGTLISECKVQNPMLLDISKIIEY